MHFAQKTSYALLATLIGASTAYASSHNEAPAIAKDTYADNTDTYVFVSPENNNNVVLAASWIPFETPSGGPNFFEWDDAVDYIIYVDNNGDARPDFTYTLKSQTFISNNATFLYNTGPITSLDDPDLNRYQTITVTETSASGTVTLVNNLRTTPANIGSKSTPDYQALINQAIYTSGTGNDQVKIFAGQTDDAFFVDLQVFDLLTLRGQQAPIGYSTGNNNSAIDTLAGYNAHTLVIEVPIDRVVDTDPVLGVWSTSERNGVQVSRLGMPLTNELVIPMSLKDTFNGLRPSGDLSVYSVLQESVEDPEVGNLLCGLYGVPLPGDANAQGQSNCVTEYEAGTPRTGRGDIFDIFLSGMVLANEFTINTATGTTTLPAGFNVNRPANVQPADMLRINTTIKGDLCAPTPSPLGVVGGDACGFPNGRRLADDVVDIALLAVAGATYQVLDGRDTSFSFNPALIPVLSDNVHTNDKGDQDVFPYFAVANSGQERVHSNPTLRSTNTDDGGGSAGFLFLSILGGLLFTRSRRQA